MNSLPSEDNLSDASFGVFGDENKDYAEVTGIDVLRFHESIKNRNKKPPPCTINLTNFGRPPSASIICDLRGDACELRRFKTPGASGCQSVLGEQDVNLFATTDKEEFDHSLSTSNFSTGRIDDTYCHDSPYGGPVFERTADIGAKKTQIRTTVTGPKPDYMDESSLAKRNDPVKAQKFQKLVERLVVNDTLRGEHDSGTSSSDPHSQQGGLALAGSRNSGGASTYLDVASHHHDDSRVSQRRDSSASERSNMHVTPNPSHGGSEVTAGSSVSDYDNIKNGDFPADTAENRGNWEFSDHKDDQVHLEKHKLNNFNPNANNFQPALNGFNPNAASFAPTSAIPMSDAAAQAVEQQKKHQLHLELLQQQQQAQALSQLAQFAPTQQHAATINLGVNDWLNPQRHQQRRQPLSNIFPDAMLPHTPASISEIGQDLLNSLAAQHIAFLTQQNAIMAATLSQQQNCAAPLGAQSAFPGISPFGLADPLIAPFNHQLPGPQMPPFGSVSSMNNGMNSVIRFPTPLSGLSATIHHGQNSQQQSQAPRHYHGAQQTGYASVAAPPPPAGMQQSLNNSQQQGYVPVQQRSLVSLAGAPPPSQTLASTMPLANQHLLRFDANGMLIDVPKPRDHSDPQLQMAYEAAIEWKKANLPGYAQSCRERQNNRIANKLQSGRQYLGQPKNMYA